MKAAGRAQFPLLSAGVFATAVVAVLVMHAGIGRQAGAPTAGSATADLSACPFWTDGSRAPASPAPPAPATGQAPALDLDSRLTAPDHVAGRLSGHQVAITFDRVPGAEAYRVWRNGEPLALVTDSGRPTVTVTDPGPCQRAFYTLMAVTDDSGTDTSSGRLSRPYQLGTDGTVATWAVPGGRSMKVRVTSYSTGGQAAAGYATGPGVCAVDPRVIPWGISFSVPGYGQCYAADVGATVKDETVAVWLPAAQAAAWQVQDRTITIGGGGPAASPAQVAGSPSPSASPSAKPSPKPSASASPSPRPGPPSSAPAPPGPPAPTGAPTPLPAPTSPPSPPFSASYEAESSANTLSGGARVIGCSGCSGGMKVGWIGQGGTLQFNAVDVPSAGTYRLTIAYVVGDAGRTADLSVDGGGATALSFGYSGGWSTPATRTVSVTLSAGANTIRLYNPSAMGPDIDRITVAQ